jgi:malic enzyme
METYRVRRDPVRGPVIEVPHRGARLQRHPIYNKGSAFSPEEREALGLYGLLPESVNSMEQQSERALANILRSPDPLQRYIALAALQERNEHLFYRVLADNLEELLPIVYTPTVGKACQEFSHIFRNGRGLWITPSHRGWIHQVLANAPFDDVRLIVVTDNERILGLGDQGAGGMGIPIGKLALYTAGAGIHPTKTLPISLDVGTDNKRLLEDPLYLGYRRPRLRGPDYDSLLDEFVHAVKKRFPRVLLQWEDFKKGNAFQLLAKYQRVLPSFNDDIQGTAAVALAGIMAGTRVSGIPLTGQRVVMLGAGAAGVGISRLVRGAMKRAGLAGEDLIRAIAVLDSRGFLADDTEIPDAYKREFAWPAEVAARAGLGKDRPRDLLSVIRALKPTVLIGTSGEPGTFTEPMIREMAAHAPHPLVFPMSNPTSKTEAIPADVLAWTDGRALLATGSPFDDVSIGGRSVRIGQGNNAFVFPGVGLGVMVSEASEVRDEMFAAAADALANCLTAEDLAAGGLFPRIRELRRVTARVAEAVVRTASEIGVGRPIEDARVPEAVAEAMWQPHYLRCEPAHRPGIDGEPTRP